MTRNAGGEASRFSRDTDRGFTLMELVVVVLVLSLTALIVLPKLSTGHGRALSDSGRKLASLIRYLETRGATTSSTFRIHFDFAGDRIRVTRHLSDGSEAGDDDPVLRRPVLAEDVSLADLEHPRLGKVSEGEVVVAIGPRGLTDHLVIHLRGEGERHVTVRAFPGRKVLVAEGYEEGLP